MSPGQQGEGEGGAKVASGRPGILAAHARTAWPWRNLQLWAWRQIKDTGHVRVSAQAALLPNIYSAWGHLAHMLGQRWRLEGWGVPVLRYLWGLMCPI